MEMIIPNIWKNRKCSKPPTSLKLNCAFCFIKPHVKDTKQPCRSQRNVAQSFGFGADCISSLTSARRTVARWRSLLGNGQGLMSQLIGLREKLQENPIFHGNIYGFRVRFSLSRPIEWAISLVISLGMDHPTQWHYDDNGHGILLE